MPKSRHRTNAFHFRFGSHIEFDLIIQADRIEQTVTFVQNFHAVIVNLMRQNLGLREVDGQHFRFFVYFCGDLIHNYTGFDNETTIFEI